MAEDPKTYAARIADNYHVGPVSGWDRYCERCGLQMPTTFRHARRFHGYYGVPEMEARRRCPRRRWLLDGHTDTGWYPMTYIPPRPSGVPPND